MQTYCRKKPLTFGRFVAGAPADGDGQLAERSVELTPPLLRAGNAVPMAWAGSGFPVRIIAKLRAAIASRVPVGYEDETGFHCGSGDFLKPSTPKQGNEPSD